MAAQLDRPVGELEVLNRAPEVLYPQAERPPGPVVGHRERSLRVDYDLRRVTEIERGLAELVGDALRGPAGGPFGTPIAGRFARRTGRGHRLARPRDPWGDRRRCALARAPPHPRRWRRSSRAAERRHRRAPEPGPSRGCKPPRPMRSRLTRPAGESPAAGSGATLARPRRLGTPRSG